MPPGRVMAAVKDGRYTDHKEAIERLKNERELLIKNGVTDSFLWQKTFR